MIPITDANRHTLPLSKIFTYIQIAMTQLKVLRKSPHMLPTQVKLMTLVGNKLNTALNEFKFILNDKSKKVLAEHILNDDDSMQCDALLEIFIAVSPESRERIVDFAGTLFDKESEESRLKHLQD